jgi:hypothetical protein
VSKDSARSRLVQVIDRLVLSCTPDLFDAYQIPVQSMPSGGAIAHDALAGAVGFLGDASGLLVLAVPRAIAADHHPLRGSTVTERMKFDWVGELANQLLGRIKLRLAEYELDVRVSAPISLEGHRLRLVGASGQICRSRFRHASGDVQVWVDADIRDSLLWSGVLLREEEATAGEGTVMFL